MERLSMPDDSLHRLDLTDVLEEHRRSHPRDLAVVDGRTRLTYPELAERVARLAGALERLGVGREDRVLWLGQNSFRMMETLLACARLGAVFCPGNWRQSAEEMAWLIGDCRPRVVIWQALDIGPRILAARKQARADTAWLVHDPEHVPDDDRLAAGDAAYEDVLRKAAAREHEWVNPDLPVLQMYTAAFAGVPAGAQISQAGVLSQALTVGAVYGVTSDYVYLNCGPLFHVGTLMVMLATFLSGGTEVFTPKADAAEICRLIEAEGCTGAFLLPPTIEKMLALNAAHRFDLTSLRVPPSGPPGLRAMATVDDNVRMHDGTFGQTEAMGLIAYHERGTRRTAGRAGRAAPTSVVRIVAPDGTEVPSGDVGEIVARGPGMMVALHDRPEITARRQRGGWHHTGDLGRREADGSLTWIGPITRFIKSAHENIYPAEVEAAIRTHPGVADVAVIGVPDPVWRQSVKAIVVPAVSLAPAAQEIIDHCRDRIASFKKPRFVEFADSLPRRGAVVDYDALDAWYGGGNYPSGA
jgi:acyl-CoA synthetase (AMP-forming)/AMP-acid ligase II